MDLWPMWPNELNGPPAHHLSSGTNIVFVVQKLMIKTICSKCHKSLEKRRLGKHRYCLSCHAEYMRRTRPKHSELNDEQRRKANARSYANTYLRRGKIKRESCKCGYQATEMHHENYDKPLEIIWMCRTCHLNTH